jgi:5-methylthioribose kinase
MTDTAAEILTVETIPQYLESNLDNLKGVVDSLDGIQVSTIVGGNVNYAFCIKLGNGNSVFLKQAPEFVAIFGPDGFPLTSERMQREMDVYTEWKTLLGDELSSKYLPTIHYFDSEFICTYISNIYALLIAIYRILPLFLV